ncbi:hypothetical protein [Sphingobacterium lumbrici]|uniref:hypothetical protein n=1 Tax=Sphingobacterium lumbrici TaxID=2559600 RepID=UPI00112BAF12|nr:hypothetical protein [Sphingobacterium lumbrici]
MSKIDFTRKQLYELVWEKPLSHIIDTYGGTYQEVKEMLKKYDIPSPENGFWSRLRAGHNIPRVALPNGNDSEKVIYEPKEKKKRIKLAEHTAAKKDIQIARSQDKLVIEAKKVFQNKRKGSEDDRLISIAYESLNINVSPKMLDRALAFFNLLIIEVKRIGGTIEVKPHHSTVIYIGERMEVSLREKQNRILKENQAHSWDTYDYLPSGILLFKLGEHSWNAKEWKDTSYTVLEDKIEDILEHIRKIAFNIQEDRRESEQRRIEQEKERQQQLELEKLQAAELNNFVEIKTNAELWQKATLMREYLTTLEDAAKKNGTYDLNMQRYLEWARKKVDWYDPLVEIEDELLKKVDKTTLTLPKKGFW